MAYKLHCAKLERHTMYFSAVLQGKRATIGMYFQEMESIDSITDSDILDHIITKLLPVVTTVRVHLELQTATSSET